MGRVVWAEPGSASISASSPTIRRNIGHLGSVPPMPRVSGLGSAYGWSNVTHSRRDHDLPEHLPFLHALLRLAQLLQGIDRVDDRLKDASLHEPQTLKQLVARTHVSAEN